MNRTILLLIIGLYFCFLFLIPCSYSITNNPPNILSHKPLPSRKENDNPKNIDGSNPLKAKTIVEIRNVNPDPFDSVKADPDIHHRINQFQHSFSLKYSLVPLYGPLMNCARSDIRGKLNCRIVVSLKVMNVEMGATPKVYMKELMSSDMESVFVFPQEVAFTPFTEVIKYVIKFSVTIDLNSIGGSTSQFLEDFKNSVCWMHVVFRGLNQYWPVLYVNNFANESESVRTIAIALKRRSNSRKNIFAAKVQNAFNNNQRNSPNQTHDLIFHQNPDLKLALQNDMEENKSLKEEDLFRTAGPESEEADEEINDANNESERGDEENTSNKNKNDLDGISRLILIGIAVGFSILFAVIVLTAHIKGRAFALKGPLLISTRKTGSANAILQQENSSSTSSLGLQSIPVPT